MSDFSVKLTGQYSRYFGSEPSAGFVDACDCHYRLLVRYNEMFNLTRITAVDESVLLHYIDSLFTFQARKDSFRDGVRICDIGTGGGFPAFPLFFHLRHNVGLKGVSMTCIEGSQKKTDFLNICSKELGAGNDLRCLHERTEDAAHDPSLRAKFEVVTARAVASLPVLLEYAVPFLSAGGHGLFMKGEDVGVEKRDSAKAVSELSVRFLDDLTYELEGMQYKRKIVVVEKTGVTPKKYPRKRGIPKKTPLA